MYFSTSFKISLTDLNSYIITIKTLEWAEDNKLCLCISAAVTALENITGLSKGKKQGGIIITESIHKFFIVLKALMIQCTINTN